MGQFVGPVLGPPGGTKIGPAAPRGLKRSFQAPLIELETAHFWDRKAAPFLGRLAAPKRVPKIDPWIQFSQTTFLARASSPSPRQRPWIRPCTPSHHRPSAQRGKRELAVVQLPHGASCCKGARDSAHQPGRNISLLVPRAIDGHCIRLGAARRSAAGGVMEAAALLNERRPNMRTLLVATVDPSVYYRE